MAQKDIKLLDCTLRDGGYVNNWEWGFQKARHIIRALTRANIDIVEVGFLRNVESYNPDITVCNHIEELNKLLPNETGHTMYSGMAMRSNYDINKLSDYSGKGIEMIRITAHDYDIVEGMDFARAVKDKGYKLSINPINIMGYTDEKILWILKQVNEIQPYQFSIVDTFGSMKRRDLDRIVSLVDNNLDDSIRVGLHLHENMSIANLLAQDFLDKHLNRSVTVDGSLMGMGRIPGNLPIELIADYVNEYANYAYDINFLMDAIQDYIEPIHGHAEWGYTPAYFLSAKYNLHRNYAEHYLKKGDLTHRDINQILANFSPSKKTAFDASYADELYYEYKDNSIDDAEDRKKLKQLLRGKSVLILAPGETVRTHEEQIRQFVEEHHPTIISVNFVPVAFEPDMAFFSNSKRYEQFSNRIDNVIVTSNIKDAKVPYTISYTSLASPKAEDTNSFILLLKLLKEMDVTSIHVAGADGWKDGKLSYSNMALRDYVHQGTQFNTAAKEAIATMNIKINFLTPSLYNV